MNRRELEQFILRHYHVEPDRPWIQSPNHEVFRHDGNRKWFALIMDVSGEKLGLRGRDHLDVVNLKCDPMLIGSLMGEPGFFSAYHMNKASWITAALDGSAAEDEIKMLLEMSFAATAPKMPRKKRG